MKPSCKVFDQLTAAGMRDVNQACDAYEQAWSREEEASGTAPDLANHLQEFRTSAVDSLELLRRALVEQLLPVDVLQRSRRGLPFDRAYYEGRLPGDCGALLDEFDWPAAHGISSSGVVGRYQLLEMIGRGGMGVVYRARQIEGVQRDVAVKILDARAAGRDSLRRFEFEGQTLATLAHDRIAKVFDTGVTDDGRAFLAMELVDGQALTKYCDTHKLDVRARLHLLIDVCRGVQHAHQRGVIHRDLKPANILVRETSEGPRVKIIDFGLARAIGVERGWTEAGQLLGTLEYLSPEQASLDPSNVDTRTDVYALGAILYELLTGSTPLCRADFPDGGFPRILDAIRRADHVPPSRRASSSGVTSPGLSRTVRRVAVELDWIVARALEKEPSRRYAGVGELADDLSRFLEDRPVEAGPPSFAYRFRKLVRRHWKVSVALGVAGLVAGSFTVTVTVLLAEVNAQTRSLGKLNQSLTSVNSRLVLTNEELASERELALEREREANDARANAERSETRAREQANLAFNTLSSVANDIQDGLREAPGSRRIREALLRSSYQALEHVAKDLVPRAEVDRFTPLLLKDVGELLINIIDRDSEGVIAGDGRLIVANQQPAAPDDLRAAALALEMFEKATTLVKGRPVEADDLDRQLLLARLYRDTGNALLLLGKTQDAEQSCGVARQILSESLVKFGARTELLLEMAELERRLAICRYLDDDFDAALDHCREGTEHLLRCPEDDRSSFVAIELQASLKARAGEAHLRRRRRDDALREFRAAITLLERQEREHGRNRDGPLSILLAKTGSMLFQAGQVAEGGRCCELALQRLKALVQIDPDDPRLHFTVWLTRFCLLERDFMRGRTSWEQGDKDQANQEFEIALQRHGPDLSHSLERMNVLAPDALSTINAYAASHDLMGKFRQHAGKHELAIDLFRRALGAAKEKARIAPDELQDRLFMAKMHLAIAASQESLGQRSESLGTLMTAREIVAPLLARTDATDESSVAVRAVAERITAQLARLEQAK